MKTNTVKKIDEASFFFKHLMSSLTLQGPVCEYYLSAFVSAARSVTFLMEKEYADKPGFKAWWAGCDKEQLKKFNDLRVVTVHQRYPKMSQRITHTFDKGLTLNAGETANIPIDLEQSGLSQLYASISNTKGGQRSVAAIQKRDFIIDAYYEKERREIKFDSFLSDASNYLDFLKEIVKECGTRFA